MMEMVVAFSVMATVFRHFLRFGRMLPRSKFQNETV